MTRHNSMFGGRQGHVIIDEFAFHDDPDDAPDFPRCWQCRHFRYARCALHGRIIDPDDTCIDNSVFSLPEPEQGNQ